MHIPDSIRSLIRRALLRTASHFEGPQEKAYENSFDGVPDEDVRRAMSAQQLARVAANAAKNSGSDSVAFILLSHELQLKLAKVQSTATDRAALVGVVGIAVGALLTSMMQSPHQCANDKTRSSENEKVSNQNENGKVSTRSHIPESTTNPNYDGKSDATPARNKP